MNEDKNYQVFTNETTFKNDIHRLAHTDKNKAWYEESQETSHQIYAHEIWQDANYIPEKPIQGVVKYIEHIGQNDVQIYEYIEDLPLNKTDKINILYNKDFVDIIDRIGYNVILKCDGEEVPFGLCKWSFDGLNGCLNFVDGFPSQWDGQFTISFYKYTGRKLNEVNLFSDGSRQMDDSYKPEEKQDIVTKQYVDSHIGKTDDVVNKLIPPEPKTIDGTSIDFYSSLGSFIGCKVFNGEQVDNVVFKNSLITLTTKRYFNEEKDGVTKLIINNHEVSNISHKTPIDTGYLKVIYNGDAYENDLNSKGFYKCLQLQTQFIPDNLPMLLQEDVLQFKYVTVFPNGTTYETQPLTLGIESIPKEFGLSENREYMLKIFPEGESHWKYISGVPTPLANDKISYSGVNITTLNNYFIKNQRIANVQIGSYNTDILPVEIGYNTKMDPIIPIEGITEVPENVYKEKFPIEINSYNLKNENNGHWKNDYPFRVDTISNELSRVYSGKFETVKELAEWDPTMSLLENKELQTLGGKIVWPEIDFSKNGSDITWQLHYDTKGWILPGPNYTLIPQIGLRYATFKYEIPYANGVYITVPEFNLVEPFKKFNIASLEVMVEGKTKWLNANKPYDGIGKVRNEGEGCLVVTKCNEHTIYVTFGPEPLNGNFYIRVGMSYENKIEFTQPTIVSNI